MKSRNQREMLFVQVSIFSTLALFSVFFVSVIQTIWHAYTVSNTSLLLESLVFAGCVLFMLNGNMLYQLCLLGNYKRKDTYQPASRDELEAIYDHEHAPKLSILVPSYKEERAINWQTLLSAAFTEYPHKNVVLLVDDPYYPRVLEDMVRLDDTRKVPKELQAMFDAPLNYFRNVQMMFVERMKAGNVDSLNELSRLADRYDEVAAWFETMSDDFVAGRKLEIMPYAERFFITTILQTPINNHRALAETLREKSVNTDAVSEQYLRRHYARLVGLFNVTFSSFERKKYANLSHEANKAMNLNSYIALIGKSWKEVDIKGALHLVECDALEADFSIPAADYVNTIDADTLMPCDYSLRLIHMMEQSENQRLAVVQSPCSSIPGCPGGLERITGACIDVQFLTHQGYSHFGASYWVGANAMLRYRALEDIRETREEEGKTVSVYIQDRTVIEDTESSIDLVSKGWQIFNYPERMTFSSMPPDYGSLLIQRRRWANGGLIILPKLLHYAWKAPKSVALVKELFMRTNYLASTTIGCFVALLFFVYPFNDSLVSSPFMLLSVVPYFVLYSRDLKNSGYRYSDVFRAYAFNMMSFPIVMGGVFKQFQQIITGKKIPFGRTPKVTGRTAAPALYCIVQLMVFSVFLYKIYTNVEAGYAPQAAFALMNAAFYAFAISYYMGIKATFEDMFASVRILLRNAFYHAEIIPLSRARKSSTIIIERKRA